MMGITNCIDDSFTYFEDFLPKHTNTDTRRNRYKLIWNDKRSTNKYANQISNLDKSRFWLLGGGRGTSQIKELMKKKQESN